MPRTVSRSVRFAFVAFTAALLTLAGVQSFAGSEPRMGLSSCGWDENPCMLDELVVKAPAVAPAAAPEAPLGRAVEHQRLPMPAEPAAQS